MSMFNICFIAHHHQMVGYSNSTASVIRGPSDFVAETYYIFQMSLLTVIFFVRQRRIHCDKDCMSYAPI